MCRKHLLQVLRATFSERVCLDTCAGLLYNKTQKGAHHGHHNPRFPYQDLPRPKGTKAGTPLHHTT